MPTATITSKPTTGIDVADVRFPIGLPGFPEARRFTAEHWGGDDSPFLLLSCTEGAEARFVIMRPQVFFPSYRPEVGDDVLAVLGLEDVADASIWVILTLGSKPEEATANLLAPLVVNAEAHLACQAVQPGRRWHPRTPVVGPGR